MYDSNQTYQTLKKKNNLIRIILNVIKVACINYNINTYLLNKIVLNDVNQLKLERNLFSVQGCRFFFNQK